MKYSFILAFLLALPLLGQIRFFDEQLKPGDELTVYANVKNPYAFKLENIEVRVLVDELDVLNERSPFHLSGGENAPKVVDVQIPKGATKGDYLVKISAKSGNRKTVKHRYITVQTIP